MCALGALMLGCASASAYTEGAAGEWDHNGSLMSVVVEGNGAITITYETPRVGIRETGVESGTVLFNGFTNGSTVSGTARVYSENCPAAFEYRVSGRMTSNQITLRGAAPDIRRCTVRNYLWNYNSTLVFKRR